jgi:hypothetical protein
MRHVVTVILGLVFVLLFPQLGHAQPTIDGDLTDAEYAQKMDADNANGFGSNNEINTLYYYADEANSDLYIGIEGKLADETKKGYALWINVTGSGAPTGKAAGSDLGFTKEAVDLLYIDGILGDNLGFHADFEVDYALALHADGSGGTKAAAASYMDDSPRGTALGSSDQSGTSTTSEGPGNFELMNWAFDDTPDGSSVSGTGAEFRIPFDEIGASASNGIELSALIVRDDAHFSNETIPGDGTQIADGETDSDGNPGAFATWDSYSGGPYHFSGGTLPVELASFEAFRDGQHATLHWTTASETNNSGFRVQHAVGDRSFTKAGWVDGAGTTTEEQTYSYSVENLSAGTHRFRLKQVDLDGTTHVSEVTTLNVEPEGAVSVQATPHPVRHASQIRVTAEESGPVSVALYDVLGRRVETLHEGRVTARQTEQFTVNASTLATGTYFLRVTGDSFTKTKRLTVAR